MSLYRFSPIKSLDVLYDAVKHVHIECNKLCKLSFNEYLPNAGNIGIFCHYDQEYELLTKLKKQLTEPSDNPNQKYFKLISPIVIPAINDIPKTTYTHLYVRKPDPYRHHVGDVDFFMEQGTYNVNKQNLLSGKIIPGVRIFPRNDLDMIELYNPDVDALGYVSTNQMSKAVRVKLSEETNL